MSDAPIFFKKTKSKTVKSREAREDDEEVTTETKTVVSNFKNRNKGRSKPQQRLSFNTNDEEEGDGNNDAIQVKRSALGKKQKFGIGAAPNSSPGSLLSSRLEQTSITSRSEGPRYDASYLEELKASTNSARPPALRPGVDGAEPNGMVIDNDLTFDASEMEGAIIEEVVDMPLVSQNPAADTMIHSESYVKSAREKRERLRKTGINDSEADYISLTVARKEEFDSGPHPESRLMREDDDLGEGDDDDAAYTGAQERIALSKKGRKEQEKQRKKGMEELIEEADEQDEETMEWEMAQVKRAVPTEANEVNNQKSQPLTYKPTA
ncbi:16265_t:CDS:2, partial [Acaulospora colombiana]